MDSIQVFLLDEALADVGGANFVTLARRALTACGCVVAAFLFNDGLVSAAAARRLRTASVLYSCSVLASPLIVRMAGGLMGPAMQLLRSSLIPFGVTSAFVVVNLVLNQIYVFDDVHYVPLQLAQPLLMMGTSQGGQLWKIQKREHPQALLKKLVQSMQKKMAPLPNTSNNNTNLISKPQQVIVSPTASLADSTLFNSSMAAVFCVAAATLLYWSNEVRRSAKQHAHAQNTKATALRVIEHPAMAKRSSKKAAATTAQPPPLQQQTTRYPLNSRQKPSSPVLFRSTPSPLTPSVYVGSLQQRASAAVITSSLVALYLAHHQPPSGWLNAGDIDN